MVIFTPLWETMKKKGFTTYTLRVKYGISGATVQRLKRNMSVSTNTLSDLCDILDCELEDVALYVRDENDKFIKKNGLYQIGCNRQNQDPGVSLRVLVLLVKEAPDGTFLTAAYYTAGRALPPCAPPLLRLSQRRAAFFDGSKPGPGSGFWLVCSQSSA